MNRYRDIRVKRDSPIKVGSRFYRGTQYPQVDLSESDIYVITGQGDRLDLLAQRFYKDSSLWWIISIANDSLTQSSLFMTEGTQIRIPMDISSVLSSYNRLNGI